MHRKDFLKALGALAFAPSIIDSFPEPKAVIENGFVDTGKIESVATETYFDLDAGEIGGRMVFWVGSSSDDSDTAPLKMMSNGEFIYKKPHGNTN